MAALSLRDLEHFDPHARAGGRERRFCCPYCGTTKPMNAEHRCLCVNVNSGLWNCKRCGAKGMLVEYWLRRPQPPGPGRHASAISQIFATAPPTISVPDATSVEGFHRQFQRVCPIADTPAEAYLASRDIPAPFAQATDCWYTPGWGAIGAAVIFLIRDNVDTVIAATGRALCGHGKQTFGPKSLGVFTTPGALNADPVALTEAPIDALSLAWIGLPALALCGSSGVPGWLASRLAQSPQSGQSRTVLQAFDNDSAGEEAAVRVEAALYLVRSIRLRPEHKDWNEDLMHGGAVGLRAWLDRRLTCEQVEAV